jgi:hypothetical protein
MVASKRKRKNYVKELSNETGDVIVEDQLKSFIADQYQRLFLSGAGIHFDKVLDCVDRRVTREMNKILLQPFTGDEIWNALDSIGDLKAPG